MLQKFVACKHEYGYFGLHYHCIFRYERVQTVTTRSINFALPIDVKIACFGEGDVCGTLADKSGNMFDFQGNTISNRAGAWSRHVFALISNTTQQSYASPCLRTKALLLLVVPEMSKMSSVKCPPVQIHFLSHSVDCESSCTSNTSVAATGHCPSHQKLAHGDREVYTVIKGGNWKSNPLVNHGAVQGSGQGLFPARLCPPLISQGVMA